MSTAPRAHRKKKALSVATPTPHTVKKSREQRAKVVSKRQATRVLSERREISPVENQHKDEGKNLHDKKSGAGRTTKNANNSGRKRCLDKNGNK